MEHSAENIMMHAPRSMDDSMPSAHSSNSFKIGERVKIKPGMEHESMGEMEGNVVEIGSPALAILFDGEEKPHKWYVASELLPAEK